MSNGYIVAAGEDLAAAQEIGAGFGVDVLEASSIDDPNAEAARLASAGDVAILISSAASADAKFTALLQALAQQLEQAHLIVADADARAAFPFLPDTWPAMTLEDARGRATALVQQRAQMDQEADPLSPAPQEEPAPPQPEQAPVQDGAPDGAPAPADENAPVAQTEAEEAARPDEQEEPTDAHHDPVAGLSTDERASNGEEQFGEEAAPVPQTAAPNVPEPAPEEIDEGICAEENLATANAPIEAGHSAPDDAVAGGEGEAVAPPEPTQAEIDAAITTDRDLSTMSFPIERKEEPTPIPAAPAPTPAPSAPAPTQDVAPPMPMQDAPPAPDTKLETARVDSAKPQVLARERRGYAPGDLSANARPLSAPADATAFAPKKLRRGSPELVRIAIHQPKDLKAVIKAAKKADARTESAPQSVKVGDIALGASIGVALEVKGAFCDDRDLQRQEWTGAPLDFNFTVEAEDDAKQAIIKARVFVNDAQIGVIVFLRPISGPKKKAASADKGERMQKFKRVFISYSSNDRELVAAIATAYAAIGVQHFWDRASLKSGEIWGPRLRREIDRADLFHLCWSKSAATSEWVEKETEHALERNQRSKGKAPSITVQMLDGPPWAKHKDSLDAINFDDFTRAAIVGYARGDGSN